MRLSTAMISSISNIVPGMGAQGDPAMTLDANSRSSCRAAWRVFSFGDMFDLSGSHLRTMKAKNGRVPEDF